MLKASWSLSWKNNIDVLRNLSWSVFHINKPVLSAHLSILLQGNFLSLSTFEIIFLTWNLILWQLEFPWLTLQLVGGVAAQLAGALVLQTFPSCASGLFTLKGEETGVKKVVGCVQDIQCLNSSRIGHSWRLLSIYFRGHLWPDHWLVVSVSLPMCDPVRSSFFVPWWICNEHSYLGSTEQIDEQID